jgi:hypothetical protein
MRRACSLNTLNTMDYGYLNAIRVFVTFGDSGSRKHNCHERGEGGELKILINQWRNEHSCRDELSHHLVFTKNDEEPGGRGHVWIPHPRPIIPAKKVFGDGEPRW